MNAERLSSKVNRLREALNDPIVGSETATFYWSEVNREYNFRKGMLPKSQVDLKAFGEAEAKALESTARTLIFSGTVRVGVQMLRIGTTDLTKDERRALIDEAKNIIRDPILRTKY